MGVLVVIVIFCVFMMILTDHIFVENVLLLIYLPIYLPSSPLSILRLRPVDLSWLYLFWSFSGNCDIFLNFWISCEIRCVRLSVRSGKMFWEKVKKKRLKPILRATRSTINFQDSALRRYIRHAALKMRNLSSHIAPQEEHDIIKDI